MSTDEPKKKRRQNVACDSCKLRRIKCDLLDILQTLPSSSADTSPADLVLQNPDVGCKNCQNKGVRCTTHGIVNPTKPNKGGKRIEEAKKKFGSGREESGDDIQAGRNGGSSDVEVPAHEGIAWASQLNPSNGSAGQHGSAGIGDIDLDTINFFTSMISQNILPPPSLASRTVPHSSMQSSQQRHVVGFANEISSGSTIPVMFDAAMLADSHLRFNSFPTESESYKPVEPLASPSTGAESSPENPPMTEKTFQESDASGAVSQASRFNQALSIWHEFANNRKEAMELVRTTGETPGVLLADQNGEPPEIPFGFTLEQQKEIFNYTQRKAIDTGPIPTAIVSVSDSESDSYSYLNFRPNPSPSPSPRQEEMFGDGRKRSRSASRDPSEGGRGGKMVLLSRNPWQLWSDGSRSDDRITPWGRKEAVQQQLVDRALGMALSNHLVKTFFQAIHFSYPAISPEAFYLDWARAGQRSDNMTPAQEALCATIEAWGARYSDSPVILGLNPHKAGSAPKVIQADGTFAPGTRARLHWGKARVSACRALLARARKLIDENGLFRNPSITGVQALTLYSQLTHMTDQKDIEPDQWLQSRMVHSTIMEQMSILGLMWDSDGPIVTDESDASLSLAQLQLKQRRLFWTHVMGDAFFSASLRQMPKISQEDIDSAGEWITTVHDRLPLSSFKVLAFLVSNCHRLAEVGRDLAIKVAYPLRKKGAGDIGRICAVVRKIWKDVREIEKDLNTRVADLLAVCNKDELLGFSPLNFLSTLRFSCPFLLFLTHQIIREQLDFWKSLSARSAAYISSPSNDSSPGNTSISSATSDRRDGEQLGDFSGTRAGVGGANGPPGSKNVELLEKLNTESVDRLLRDCRAQMGMLESIIPTGIIQSASIFLRVLMATAQLLSEVPTNEQGYPHNTPGGYGWTWEAKQKEVNCCMEALHQVGWAWADVGDVLDNVMLTMERMTPSPEMLREWQVRQSQGGVVVNQDIAVTREKDMNDSKRTMGVVLRFWPPLSIPSLIERAMNKNPSSIMEGDVEHLKDRFTAGHVRRSSSGVSASPASSFQGRHSHPDQYAYDTSPSLHSLPSAAPTTSHYGSAVFPDITFVPAVEQGPGPPILSASCSTNKVVQNQSVDLSSLFHGMTSGASTNVEPLLNPTQTSYHEPNSVDRTGYTGNWDHSAFGTTIIGSQPSNYPSPSANLPSNDMSVSRDFSLPLTSLTSSNDRPDTNKTVLDENLLLSKFSGSGPSAVGVGVGQGQEVFAQSASHQLNPAQLVQEAEAEADVAGGESGAAFGAGLDMGNLGTYEELNRFLNGLQ